MRRSSVRPEPERALSSPEVSEATAPDAGREVFDLLSADGSPIPIGRGRGKGRELGRYASESWKRLSKAAGEIGKSNPSRLAVAGFVVGLVAGAALGALFARE